MIFSLERPTLQHFEESLRTFKILPGGRLNAFGNSVCAIFEQRNTTALQ